MATGDSERPSPTAAAGLLQHLYDVTTWLLSVAPTGRVDQGAYVPYHDALVALSDTRDFLRQHDLVRHDESWWNKHAKRSGEATNGATTHE
jgi:hypothetical protein